MPQQPTLTEDYSSSEEDDTTGHAPNQALPIANLPSDFNGTPRDGMEYLFTVRRDSRLLPRFTRAADHPVSNGAEGTAAAEPPRSKTLHSAFPTEEWRVEYVKGFLNYRQNLRRALKAQNDPGSRMNAKVQLPSWQRREDWWLFITGTERRNDALAASNAATNGAGGSGASASEPLVSQPHEPSLSVLKQFSMRNTTSLLYWFSVWITEHADALEEASGPSPSVELTGNGNAASGSSETLRRIDDVHQRWMFALLGVLDAELVGNDISTLRVLARSAIRLIKMATKEEVAPILEAGDATPSSEAEGTVAGVGEVSLSPGDDGRAQTVVSGCWMVVAAIGGIWGQRDIWDEAQEALSH